MNLSQISLFILSLKEIEECSEAASDFSTIEQIELKTVIDSFLRLECGLDVGSQSSSPKTIRKDSLCIVLEADVIS